MYCVFLWGTGIDTDLGFDKDFRCGPNVSMDTAAVCVYARGLCVGAEPDVLQHRLLWRACHVIPLIEANTEDVAHAVLNSFRFGLSNVARSSNARQEATRI